MNKPTKLQRLQVLYFYFVDNPDGHDKVYDWVNDQIDDINQVLFTGIQI
jgi:hypothetical protein